MCVSLLFLSECSTNAANFTASSYQKINMYVECFFIHVKNCQQTRVRWTYSVVWTWLECQNNVLSEPHTHRVLQRWQLSNLKKNLYQQVHHYSFTLSRVNSSPLYGPFVFLLCKGPCGFGKIQCILHLLSAATWTLHHYHNHLVHIVHTHTWSEVFLLQVVRRESVEDEVSPHLGGTQILFILLQSRRQTPQNCTHLLLYLRACVCSLTHAHTPTKEGNDRGSVMWYICVYMELVLSWHYITGRLNTIGNFLENLEMYTLE